MQVCHGEPLKVRRIFPGGLSALLDFVFPNAVTVELSGLLNLKLKIYPSHVSIEGRRWMSSTSVLARFTISIPVYDEIGDSPAHMIEIRSAIAFLYPFVPMHVQVAVDDEVVFVQGKFEA